MRRQPAGNDSALTAELPNYRFMGAISVACEGASLLTGMSSNAWVEWKSDTTKGDCALNLATPWLSKYQCVFKWLFYELWWVTARQIIASWRAWPSVEIHSKAAANFLASLQWALPASSDPNMILWRMSRSMSGIPRGRKQGQCMLMKFLQILGHYSNIEMSERFPALRNTKIFNTWFVFIRYRECKRRAAQCMISEKYIVAWVTELSGPKHYRAGFEYISVLCLSNPPTYTIDHGCRFDRFRAGLFAVEGQSWSWQTLYQQFSSPPATWMAHNRYQALQAAFV